MKTSLCFGLLMLGVTASADTIRYTIAIPAGNYGTITAAFDNLGFAPEDQLSATTSLVPFSCSLQTFTCAQLNFIPNAKIGILHGVPPADYVSLTVDNAARNTQLFTIWVPLAIGSISQLGTYQSIYPTDSPGSFGGSSHYNLVRRL